MTVILYRSSLRLTSGAGQLIRMQAEALRANGQEVRVACRRGGLKFFLRTRLPTRRMSLARVRALAAAGDVQVIDHGMEVPEAPVVHVHNLMTEGIRLLPRDDWRELALRERAYFEALRTDARIVANSELVRRALLRHFPLAPDRIVVEHPRIDTERFLRCREEGLRRRARTALGVGDANPLVGFVTSGDFAKRGLDVFMDAAARIAAARPDTRFLVVGSRRLPQWAARHPLVRAGILLHRPKSSSPERWFAALDLFLYPAHFEEFGMVVSEAQVAGLPVLTSRRVGASECLAPECSAWLLERPDAMLFAERAIELLNDRIAERPSGSSASPAWSAGG